MKRQRGDRVGPVERGLLISLVETIQSQLQSAWIEGARARDVMDAARRGLEDVRRCLIAQATDRDV
jgi:hypothetical protein